MDCLLVTNTNKQYKYFMLGNKLFVTNMKISSKLSRSVQHLHLWKLLWNDFCILMEIFSKNDMQEQYKITIIICRDLVMASLFHSAISINHLTRTSSYF